MPVVIQTFVTSEPETGAALADLRQQLTEASSAPDFVFAFYSGEYDDVQVHGFLHDYAPGVPLIGGTSGRGVMSHAGLGAERSIGIMTITDDVGSFGVASAPLGDDPAATAEQTIHRALAAADATGELPELVWIYQAPGHEEEVLTGLRRVVGDRCPIVGGTAAGEAHHDWRQLGTDGPLSGGLVVAVLFPSGGVSVSYQSGFEPTGDSGIVTGLRAGGAGPQAGDRADEPASPRNIGRHIATIDGEPAAQVYNRWLGGRLPAEAMAEGGGIALLSAWYPLGAVAGDVDGLTYFRLLHIDSITRDGGLLTFAAVPEGSRVFAMRGSRSSLIHRAGRVANSAISTLEGEGGGAAGALMVYCIGCRLAVGDEITDVVQRAREGFGGAPFLGCFTSGEQGPVLVENVHANLMISAVVFGR
jgi:hypothetical protein